MQVRQKQVAATRPAHARSSGPPKLQTVSSQLSFEREIRENASKKKKLAIAELTAPRTPPRQFFSSEISFRYFFPLLLSDKPWDLDRKTNKDLGVALPDRGWGYEDLPRNPCARAG